MSDWQQQIEAQIAEIEAFIADGDQVFLVEDFDWILPTMKALLDLAVAADALDYFNQTQRIRDALDKLREVCDE